MGSIPQTTIIEIDILNLETAIRQVNEQIYWLTDQRSSLLAQLRLKRNELEKERENDREDLE